MKLFISYARKDFDLVAALVEILRVGGHDPWFDYRLLPGQNWKRELHNAIVSCEAFVYMLTPQSLDSEWCQWEFAEAVKLGKPVIPILLRTCDMPDSISAFQYCDFSGGITAYSVAKLYGGLSYIISNQPQIDIPAAPENPLGLPAHAANLADHSHFDEVIAPPGYTGLPDPFEWREIPAGEVTLIDAGGYLKKPETYLVERFWMAKYPITNAQYRVFVNEPDGYINSRWWDFSPDARYWQYANLEARNTAFEGYDLPRTNVTWYEAMAFCHWMTSKLSNAGKIASSWGVRLPTEQEWQRAAQGRESHDYPWGSHFDPARANTNESYIGKATPVTQYQSGASPFGVLDMSGNVWEWCLTDWDTGESSINGIHPRGLRGGAWISNRLDARPVSRYWGSPSVSDSFIGFRVVVAPLQPGH